MRRLLTYLIILGIAVYVGLKIQADPGYVLIAYSDWTMEMPLWFAALSLVLGGLLIYVLFYLLKNILGFNEKIRTLAHVHQQRKIQKLSQQGIQDFIEGKWQTAEKCLTKGIENNKAPLINYLIAAKAAHAQTKYLERDQYLIHAQQIIPEATTAIALTQVQLQMEQTAWKPALNTLLQLQSRMPQHPLILQLLKSVYIQLQDWPALANLMPSLRKYRIYSPDTLNTLEIIIDQQLLVRAIQQYTVIEVKKLWQSFSKLSRKNQLLIETYVRFLLAQKADNVAEVLLRESLNNQWNEHLVNLYGISCSEDLSKQLTIAKQWQKAHPHSLSLYLCLARLCTAQELFTKAQDYLKHSLNLQPTSTVYYELGLVLQKIGESEKAAQHFASGLKLAQQELQDYSNSSKSWATNLDKAAKASSASFPTALSLSTVP